MMAIGHRVGRRGALKPMLVLLFLSSVLLLTIISRTDKKRPFNLEPRHVQDSHDDYAGRRHLTRSFQTDLRKRAVMPEILDPDAEITGMSKRWSEPEKNATIEFNTRHKKKTYVRFILAKSVSEDKDSLPVTISQKEVSTVVLPGLNP